MFTSTKSGAAAVAVALSLLCVSCGASGTNGTGTDGGTPAGTTASASATPPAGREAGDAPIGKLNGALDGDRSPENLKKHRSLLIGTRDRINTWMQGHPDDYR
ncbi:hypothetical protein [Streptomyces sp. NPDC057325]|uniref:hypothetical protein n=1 Tax=unclassified Streptomyces TaxID=2593676 RepID=UPI00363A61EB